MAIRSDDNSSQCNIYSTRLNGRYYQSNHKWYFYTREGPTLGPYTDKESAKQGLNDYLDFLTLASFTTLELYFKYTQRKNDS